MCDQSISRCQSRQAIHIFNFNFDFDTTYDYNVQMAVE